MQIALISEIRNLWFYLCKPIADWNIERPRITRIKSKLFLVRKACNKVGKAVVLTKIRIYNWLHFRSNASFSVAFWPDSGSWPPNNGLHDHTYGHTTLCRTHLDEWSARRRDLYPQHNKITTDSHPRPSAGFEPVNPASEWLQNHAVDCAASGIGRRNVKKYSWNVDSVICKVCYVSVRTLKDNDFYKNYLFYLISLFYSSKSHI